MNIKTIIIGIVLIIGIAFVASEYGAFQELSVATSGDSPELVYQVRGETFEYKYLYRAPYPEMWSICRAEPISFDVDGKNIIYVYLGDKTLEASRYCNGPVLGSIADYCYFGVEDPNPYDDVVEYKCIGYCAPLKSVCDGSVLQTCNADGSAIDKVACEYGCENSACLIPEVLFALNLQTADSYVFGQDVSVQASMIVNDKPHPGSLINGKIIKDGGVIAETSVYTDDNGVADLVFTNVEGIGDATIQVSTVHLGEVKTTTEDIYFGGEAIIFTPTTYSYIQYTTKDVEFTIEIKDGKGRYITPTTGELTVISTMTSANVLSNNVEYIGNGKYRITSDVSGSGLYNGKVNLLYQGVNFESIGISIDIRDVTIDIDTSDITPVATLGNTETIAFYTMSSLGGNIEPDEITIEVSYPGGYITDTLTMNDLTRVNTGSYEFDYTFNEIEKFTFNIYADKEDYTRGTARASVSVASTVEEAFNPIVFVLNNMNLIIGGVVLIIGFVLYRRYKK